LSKSTFFHGYIALSYHEWALDNLKQWCKPEMQSKVCITFENCSDTSPPHPLFGRPALIMGFKGKNLRLKGATRWEKKGWKVVSELRDIGKSFASWKVGKRRVESRQNQRFC